MQTQRIPEWEEAPNGHVNDKAAVPRSWRDLTSYVLCPTRCIEPTGKILTKDSTQDSQREAH